MKDEKAKGLNGEPYGEANLLFRLFVFSAIFD